MILNKTVQKLLLFLPLLFLFSGYISPEKATPQMISYYHSQIILFIITCIWYVLIPSLFLWSGFSSMLVQISSWAAKKKFFWTLIIYFSFYHIVSSLLKVPLNFYSKFLMPLEYGRSIERITHWFYDTAFTFVLIFILGILLLWIPYFFIRKYKKWCWLYLGLLSLPAMLLLAFVEIKWINPRFDELTPLKNQDLHTKIECLASKVGESDLPVYIGKKAIFDKTMNLYVSGFWIAKQIVLFEPEIERMNDPEILFLVAHNLGHIVLHHLYITLGFYTLINILILGATFYSSKLLLRKYAHVFRFRTLGTPASSPLLLSLILIFYFLLSPGINAFAQYLEKRADLFALELTQNSEAAASALVKMQQEISAVPNPNFFYQYFMTGRISFAKRIENVNCYHPWGDPQSPGKFQHHMQSNKPCP